MTTRAREVEALLRNAVDSMGSCHECYRDTYPPNTHRLLIEAASALSALIAECETAKAELAEAVKVMEPFAAWGAKLHPVIDNPDYEPTNYGVNVGELRAATAFIARHPQPVPVGGEKP